MGSHSARPPSTSTVADSRQAREETVTLTASWIEARGGQERV
jgi:hypothetical protein